jgi:hypothetical protein
LIAGRYLGDGGRMITGSIPAQAKLTRPYLKNKYKVKGLRLGLKR